MTKVLVIENEEIFREILTNILEREGFETMGAENGSQGLNLAREFLPDVILCDVKMPELNGYDVLRAIRQNQSTATIPFIFLTAETIHSVIDQGQLLGANGYLTKPFSTAQLLEIIHKGVRGV